ncbi:hypothetical protein B0H21DRAFT_894579, partial [Amylocystis lapponica]
MPLSRSHVRQKSRSPAPNTLATTLSPRQPAFLPPSHYAAAAGINGFHAPESHESMASRQTNTLSPSQEYMASYMNQFSAPSSYLDQSHFSESPTNDAPPAPSTSHLNRVSRFISRSPSRSSSVSLRRSSSKGSKHEKDREPDVGMDQLGEIPLMEMQLLPTLRDTIDRMTHPPQTTSEHGVNTSGTANANSSSPYLRTPKISGRRSSAAAPPSTRSAKQQPATPTVILTPAMPSPPRSAASLSVQYSASTSTPRATDTPKSSLKSALRIQSPASSSMPEDVSSRSMHRKSLRSLKPMASRSPITPNTVNAEPPSPGPRTPNSVSDPKRSRSRLGDAPASDSHKSSLPLPKSKARSNPATPQTLQKFPAFTTPQLTPKPSSLPRSHIPRAGAASGTDSGSELERRVSRTLAPGRLVVANAAIVPS